jgi:hypothetical protein
MQDEIAKANGVISKDNKNMTPGGKKLSDLVRFLNKITNI